MKTQASHTRTASTSSLRLLPEIGLVDLAGPLLSERLAGKVSEQLEAFARMREGLLAATVAIGLDMMSELVDAEVTEVACECRKLVRAGQGRDGEASAGR